METMGPGSCPSLRPVTINYAEMFALINAGPGPVPVQCECVIRHCPIGAGGFHAIALHSKIRYRIDVVCWPCVLSSLY